MEDLINSIFASQRFLEDGNNTLFSDVPSTVPSLFPTTDFPSLSPTFEPSDAPSVFPSSAPTTELSETERDSVVLKNTCRLYGSLFFVFFVAFCYLRRKFPRAYTIRAWVEDNHTKLAEQQYGFFSWAWSIFFITDTEMIDECGMDSTCFVRILEFGLKLSLFGMLNAAWLIPVYATAKEDDLEDVINDPVLKLSVSNLPTSSYRFIATVMGAYCIFGYAMRLILVEFNWFILNRHRFLSKPMARNYAVYIRNIPHEYRTSAKLREFFEQSFPNKILDAKISLKLPALKKLVAERDGVIAKLEHAINIEDVKGKTPMVRSSLVGGEKVNQIDQLYERLNELNAVISESIEKLEITQDDTSTIVEERRRAAERQRLADEVAPGGNDGGEGDTPLLYNHPYSSTKPDKIQTSNDIPDDISELNVSIRQDEDEEVPPTEQQKNDKNTSMLSLGASAKNMKNMGSAALGKSMAFADGVAGSMKDLVKGAEDGEPLTAGFVTFTSLQTTHAALQMLQYPRPFAMEVQEAPQPEDVFWFNVGKTHKELQLGKLLSIGLTTALCLLWTIPMGFISTLASVEGLRGEFEWVDTALTKFPILEPALEQVAPLLIIVANEALKVILEVFSMFEGPVSGAVVQSLLFTKLAAFMIIQTFFVSALSGGVISELSRMVEQPGEIVNLLAVSLPGQSTFFIQIMLVDTFLTLGLELLRVTPIAIAIARKFIGPNLTQKERETTFIGIRPLADPREHEHADVLAGSVLYFMVYFVYATIAPISTFFMALGFLIMGMIWRHQFIYICKVPCCLRLFFITNLTLTHTLQPLSILSTYVQTQPFPILEVLCGLPLWE